MTMDILTQSAVLVVTLLLLLGLGILHREVGLQIIDLEVGVAHRLRLEVVALHAQAGGGVRLANVLQFGRLAGAEVGGVFAARRE